MRPVTPDGTPESQWQRWWQDSAPFAELDLAGLTAASTTTTPAQAAPVTAARVVVLAAHPDDEVLAVGGLCRRLHDAGVSLCFVWASDGEAAFGEMVELWGGSGDDGGADLAALRRAEALDGLSALGVMPAPTHTLGLPDGALAGHEDALQRAVDALVTTSDVLLAPWLHDRHPDHEVCGRVASRSRAARVLHYPVWLWHWASPGGPGVPWQRMRGVVLSEQESTAKAAAVAKHGSQVTAPAAAPQVGAVLPPSVLAYFRRGVEVVVT